MYNSPIAVLKGIKTEFAKQLGQLTDPAFKPFVQMVKSSGSYENYRFLDSAPRVKEWLGSRTQQDFKDYKYLIQNKHWEMTIDVNRDTLEDSKENLGGDIEKDVRAAAIEFNGLLDDITYGLITANGAAYDGSTFFATSHNIDGTNAIDNLKTGSGITLAQLETDLATARNAIYGYRDKNDRSINPNPRFVVLCPSHLNDKFLTLRNSQQIYDGSGNKTNIYNNSFDIVINYLQSTSDNDWYLINTNGVILPFIYQERQALRFNMVDDLSNIYIKYLMDQRCNAGYGAFTSIVKVNN